MNAKLKAGIIGGLAGLAGAAAMTSFEYAKETLSDGAKSRPAREPSERGGRDDTDGRKRRARATGRPQEDATVKAAQSLAKLLTGKELPKDSEHAAGVAVHLAFALIS